MIVSRQSSMCSATALLTMSSIGGKSFPILYIPNRKFLYLAVCTGNLLALTVGISFAWSSPMLPKLRQDDFIEDNPLGYTISSEQAAWVGSLLPFGGMFGTFITSYTAAKFGRKKSMLLTCAIPFVVAYTMLANARTLALFYFARVLIGCAVSGVYTVTPIYLGEIAEDSIRGFICTSMMTFETFGELITYCSGPYLSIFSLCMVAVGITTVISLVILIYLPESPYYLLTVKDKEGAQKALMTLRNDTKEGVKSELDFMERIVQEGEETQGTIRELFSYKPTKRATMIIIGLTIFQHFSGVIPIVIYSQTIFNETGSSIPPHFCSMIIGVVQFSSSFVAPNLVDRLGRRIMLLLSALGMMISELFMGMFFYCEDKGWNVTYFFWLPVVCLIVFELSYLSGFGPLIWTIMGELFPPNMKAAAFGICVFLWWFMAFSLTRAFMPISVRIGMGRAFWIFSGSCGVSIIFIFAYVIETKGISLEEIQQLLNK